MQKFFIGLAGLALALLGGGAANAEDTVKIGMINAYSGQFADTGAQIDNGIKLYMKQHGDTRRRQEDRAHPQGHRRHRARRRQAPGAGARSCATTPTFSPVSR